MDDPSSELARQVENLASRVAALETRLAAMESKKASPRPTDRPLETRTIADVPFNLALIGRALLALGGAFLLRAITEAGRLPLSIGVSAGFLYAASWIVMAQRAARRGEATRAQFHGVLAALIAYPLLWEATVRFKLLPAAVAALLWIAISLVLIAVAAWHRLKPLGWIVLAIALATAIGLAFSTRFLLPFAIALLVMAAASSQIEARRGWRFFAWPGAAATDIVFLLLVLLVIGHRSVHQPLETIVAVIIFVVVNSLISTFTPATARSERIFWLVQEAAALLIAVPALENLVRTVPQARFPTATLLIAAGLASYGWLFYQRNTIDGLRIGVVAAALTWSGTAIGFGAAVASALWALATLILLWCGLGFHAMAFAIAAGIGSGLLWVTTSALFLSRRTTLSPVMVLISAAILAFAFLATARPSRSSPFVVVSAMALAVWIAMGMVVIPLLRQPPSQIAVIRVAVFAIAAVAIVFLARREHLDKVNYLVYPLLVLGSAILVIEGLRVGNASTLFVSLAIYGGALVAIAQFRRAKAI